MLGWLYKALGNLSVGAILALQGYRHPAVSVDSLVCLHRGLSVDALVGFTKRYISVRQQFRLLNLCTRKFVFY